MHTRIFQRWAFFSLLNFTILAVVGVLLRYKILFPLPGVHQKNLLHGHSHFAFSGWVGMALFTGMLWVIHQYQPIDIKKYNRLFWLGQLANFGMLFTFPFMGYKLPSIAFSTLSVLFSYAFAFHAWRDMAISGLPIHVKRWFRAAIIFLLLSTVGTFVLAYLMTSKGHGQEWYIGAVYFFLHFQYNGWFLFAILGFFTYFLGKVSGGQGDADNQRVFNFLAIATLPAFFLSALWMRLPGWMYWMAVLAALLQLAALIYVARILNRSVHGTGAEVNCGVKWLWGFALLAFVLKILMQALSVIPSVTHFAFGFRPLVIGYLHMVLLGLVSFFLLGFLLYEKLLPLKISKGKKALGLFISAVILNEVLLMIQGAFSIWLMPFPYVNDLLFLAAILILLGLSGILKAVDRRPS